MTDASKKMDAVEMELLPCPFCGSPAEIIEIESGENAGGSCVSCTKCQASSNVEFEFKENFVSNWNRRATALSQPQVGMQEGWKMVPVEPTEEMEDFVRHLWLWYAGISGSSTWTIGQHNIAGGHKWILTEEEAGERHLPKHIMARICYRNMLAKSPAPPQAPGRDAAEFTSSMTPTPQKKANTP